MGRPQLGVERRRVATGKSYGVGGSTCSLSRLELTNHQPRLALLGSTREGKSTALLLRAGQRQWDEGGAVALIDQREHRRQASGQVL